jgi:tripartite-type tricarboxylate transporter receptor subunit TctC
MKPRQLLAAVLAVALGAVVASGTASPAGGQAYPNRPVKILIGFAAGGLTDVVGRLVAQKLSEGLKQQFVVENRPGAGSNIAMGLAARSAPDGYTLLTASSAFVVNPTLYGANATYDPYKDFAPITVVAVSPNGVFVNPSVPAKTMKELIEAIHANPGKYSIATAGLGTTPDLAAELLRMTFKLDAVRVPFNGGAPGVQSVLQGQTPIGLGAIPPATELIRSGQLRGLAVASKRRVPALPDVPTLAEAGIADQESETFAALLAPAGTPKEIVDLLHNEVVKALADPTVNTRLIELGFDPVGNTPAEFTALIKAEIEKWGKVIRAANMKVD